MDAKQRESLIHKLDELDREIAEKSLAFKDQGKFADQHQAFLAELRQRQAAIRRKIDTGLERGMSWNLIKTEFQRDFDGLHSELLRWLERADAASMTRRR